jgi:hypothetical protein
MRHTRDIIPPSPKQWTEQMNELSTPKPRRRRQSKPAEPAKAMIVAEHEMRNAAYYLWEEEGRPEGRALDHWLRVSRQLLPNPGKITSG